MKPLTLPITKVKINKKTLTNGVVVVLFLVALGSYVWLQNSGRIPKVSLDGYLKQLTAGLTRIPEKQEPLKTEEKARPEELEITLPEAPKIYKETAEAGEGITHLARKAIKEYLESKGNGLKLTPEHKIYIEDYLQKHTGDRWLDLGEEVSFSEELIKEAIERSQQLTSEQLNNLKQYSALVTGL